MSALFNLQSLIVVLLLTICTCVFLKKPFPSLIDHKNQGFSGVLGKFALVGERLSPYVSGLCAISAVSVLLFK